MSKSLDRVVVVLHGLTLVACASPSRPDDDGPDDGDRTYDEHHIHYPYSSQCRHRWVSRLRKWSPSQ